MKMNSIFFALALATATVCAQDATWLPASSTGALAIDYKAIRAIPMLAKLIDQQEQLPIAAPGGAQASALLKESQKDISKMLVAMLPGKSADEMHGVAFISGTFDTAQLAAKLKADSSCKVAVKDGVTIYAVPTAAPASAGQKAVATTSYVTFPSKGLIVGADDVDALLLGLKTQQKKAPALAADSMVARAVSKKFPFVVVANVAAQAKQGMQTPMTGTALPEFFAFTLRPKDDTHVLANLTGAFASAEEASQTATTLNGMKTMFAMQAAANPNAAREQAAIGALLSAITVGSNGKNATASLTLDEAMLKGLVDMIPVKQPAAAR